MENQPQHPDQPDGGEPDFSAIGPPQTGRVFVPEFKARQERRKLSGPAQVQGAIHGLAIWGLRFGALLLIALFGVRVWHLIAPLEWRWLWGTELESIDKMLFSSALGGLIVGYLRGIMDTKPPSE